MRKKHISKSSIIINKNEKVKKVFEVLNQISGEEEFITTFREKYPEDWQRILKRYDEHKRLRKKGKAYPMPEPNKYLGDIYKLYKNKKING